ncbi:MAG: hypothetical protein WA450_22055 [Candidatus Acidiferrales bacterium]
MPSKLEVSLSEKAEIRRILPEHFTRAQNQGADFKGLGAYLDTALANIEKFVRGEISNQQLARAKIPNVFRTPPKVPPPEWLEQDIAKRILDIVSAGGADREKRGEELSVWIKKSNPAPGGAPWRPENYLLGLQAQEKYDSLTPRSWMKVALQICPQKGPGHKCSALCADRLRQAARQCKMVAV